ncbi:hypothetical protein, partial [Microbacterium sp. NPDC097977]|uniref:hypothetical protein n=1 Tax=Microbacterium sp. NPDC097977 TaxID=3155686 RepID=UPI00332558B3
PELSCSARRVSKDYTTMVAHVKRVKRVKSTRWPLFAAIVTTAIIVGITRHFVIELQSESIQPSAQVVRSGLASVLIFIVGGVPAALVSEAIMLRTKPNGQKSLLECLLYAVAGNLVSFLCGSLLLYFLIWDLAGRMLVLGALATLGTIAVSIALWSGQAGEAGQISDAD